MRQADTILNQQIGLRIRQQRIRLGLTQAQLGAVLGVTFQQIQKYEKGINSLSVTRLLAVAAALDIPLSHLLEQGVTTPSGVSGRKYLHLVRQLEQLERHNPDSFHRLLNVIAIFAGTQPP